MHELHLSMLGNVSTPTCDDKSFSRESVQVSLVRSSRLSSAWGNTVLGIFSLHPPFDLVGQIGSVLIKEMNPLHLVV